MEIVKSSRFERRSYSLDAMDVKATFTERSEDGVHAILQMLYRHSS